MCVFRHFVVMCDAAKHRTLHISPENFIFIIYFIEREFFFQKLRVCVCGHRIRNAILFGLDENE